MTLRFTPDIRLRRWDGPHVLAGGSPWQLIRVRGAAAAIVDRAYRPGGLRVEQPAEARIVRDLVGRGILHPRPGPRPGPHDVTVVIPAYGRPAALTRCLRSLGAGVRAVIVVDDATAEPSPLRAIAAAAGAQYVRLAENRGPAAARNAGLARATTGLVAFVDTDCQPQPGWLDRLVPFFDDPRVAVVAPRVVPADPTGTSGGDPATAGRTASVLARYERSSSALDMGRHPALVRPGALLGFVPSATLLVRRDMLRQHGFAEALRLGEDVDLVWRLADAGFHVRYEPGVVVHHDVRGTLVSWAARRFEYGTSAVDLAVRHPGRLAPARVSPWNAAAIALLALGRPRAALATSAVAAAVLTRRLHRQGIGGRVAARVVLSGIAADSVAIGQTLRREYVPLGALAAVSAVRSRPARVAVALMAVPVLLDWIRERPRLDPVRYGLLRALADGAYGSGVLASSLRRGNAAPLRPGARLARSAKDRAAR